MYYLHKVYTPYAYLQGDGRTHGRTDGRMDGRTDGRTDGQTDGRTDAQTDGRTDGWKIFTQYSGINSCSMGSTYREYNVNHPTSATLGSRFGKCTCGFPKKEGIPCQRMVAVSKLGRVDGLTRAAIMPHWYTTAQRRSHFPKNSYIGIHQTLNQLKQTQLHMMNCVTAPTSWGPKRRVIQRRISARRVLLTKSCNQQRRSAGQLKPPKFQRRRESIWR